MTSSVSPIAPASPAAGVVLRAALAPKGDWEHPVFLLAASFGHWLLGDGAYAARRSNLLVPA